jgi:hypothetical protein
MRDMYIWQRPGIFMREKHIFSLERLLHMDYDCKSSVTEIKKKEKEFWL